MLWFLQNEATAQATQNALNVVRKNFPGRAVSLRGDVEWPAQSANLSMCDFFLWDYLKEKVLKHCPYTLPELTLRDQNIEEVTPFYLPYV